MRGKSKIHKKRVEKEGDDRGWSLLSFVRVNVECACIFSQFAVAADRTNAVALRTSKQSQAGLLGITLQARTDLAFARATKVACKRDFLASSFCGVRDRSWCHRAALVVYLNLCGTLFSWYSVC